MSRPRRCHVPPQIDSSRVISLPMNNAESDPMSLQMICPNLRCRKFLAVPDEVRGKLVKCQHCQTSFRVPEAKPNYVGPSPVKK
jgi:hypothetical protein